MNFSQEFLNPGGLLVITFHGPYIIQKIEKKESIYGLEPNDEEALVDQYSASQFGYVNYYNSNDYGISVSSPANTLRVINEFISLKVISYIERAWDNHQDVCCCQKIEDTYDYAAREETSLDSISIKADENDTKSQIIGREFIFGEKPNVIFCLPEGLTLGGVTTWSVELSRGLNDSGFFTYLGVHPSRYNNPPLDFGITANDHLIDCTHLLHPDDPKLNARDYIPFYQKALPGVLIPSWSWGTYAMASLFASNCPEMFRVIGMAHSDESGYYQWLVHYEEMIYKFIVANSEIQRKLSFMIPERVDDIYIKSAPVNVPDKLIRTYSPPGKPLQIIYGGRIAQYQKQVFKLIDLIEALIEEEVNFNIRIIGGGADKDAFYKKVNQLPEKTRRYISLEDSVPLSQLPELWHSTDINVMVSDFEGVSNSMLMGMAEGCVPVMTKVSGTSEVITSGTDGYLTPVGDMPQMAKMIKMIDLDRSILEKLGENAHNKVKGNYSSKEYLSWFTQVVDQIWKEPARPWPPKNPPMPFEQIHQKFLQMSRELDRKSNLMIHQGKKTVLFLSHDPNWGGAPKVLFSLIKGLDKEKWNPIVALPDHGELETKFREIGIKTIITPMVNITTDVQKYWQQYERFSSTLRMRVEKVVDIITQEQVDLVFSNTICIFEGALAAKLKGIPHVWYVHELSSMDDLLTPLLDYQTFYATMDLLSEKIVVISKAVQAEITQFFPSKKLELIYTGLEPIEKNLEINRKKTLNIDPDIPVIAYIGIISKRKGVLTLIDTAITVAKKYPQIKFVIAGKKEGETYNKLQELVIEKSLENNFQFLGFRNDIQDIIACSDMVVIPSIIEPFSLVAIEAMREGIPVVATRSGGPEEIIENEDMGVLVPINSPFDLAQAIIRLLENPELRSLIGENGLKHFSEHFTYERYISRFEALLDDVCKGPKYEYKDNENVVENIIKLTAVASKAKAYLATLNRKENPIQIITKLLNYPGYMPFNIIKNDDPTNKPKMSICVPIYNGSLYIKDCIDSILAQSFTDFELILVNDASTDDSKEIIQSFRDQRIKYFENERNLGLVGNWNRCLELSIGEFICIFHQDDTMSPTNIEQKVSVLNSEKSIGFVYSDTHIIDQKGKKKLDHWFNLIDPNIDFIRPGRSFFDLMFESLNIICCPSVLARRECYEKIGGFDERLPFSCDMEMWMRISLFYDIAYLSQPLIQYRFHESNLTQSFLDLDLIHVYLCKRMLLEKYPAILGVSYNDTLIEDISQRIFERAVHHYHMRQYRIARQYLYFLETIRNSMEAAEIIDFHIKQLQSYVSQANAFNLMMKFENNTVPAPLELNINFHSRPNRSARFYTFIETIKPYIPTSIKNRLRPHKGKIIR